MRIRCNTVSVSTILFTISLIVLVPHNLRYASTWPDRTILETEHLRVQNNLAPIGFASLAFVLVSLIVLWRGYIREVRWTWFVMFAIVWVFAFPVYMLPILLDLHAAQSVDWSAWFWNVVKSPGLARDYVKGPADFLLMVLALFLPIRSILRKPADGAHATNEHRSPLFR